MRPTWVFDVDGCLIDLITGSSLRPLATELLEELQRQGIDVVLWSAGGASYARRRAHQVGIEQLVAAVHGKSHRGDDGRWRTDELTVGRTVLAFVDDAPEELPVGLPVFAVSPYLAHSPHDAGLAGVLSSARGGSCPS